jgi:hypothetical protein
LSNWVGVSGDGLLWKRSRKSSMLRIDIGGFRLDSCVGEPPCSTVVGEIRCGLGVAILVEHDEAGDWGAIAGGGESSCGD